MLKQILCISGRPGLYRLLSYGKNLVIVENVTDKKRQPVGAREKIISLGDVAIYTTADDVPLGEVLDSVYKKYGKEIDLAELKTNDQLDAFMEGVLPDYDKDRVYRTDIKKLAQWYNLLVKAGFTEFTAKPEEAPAEDEQKQD